MGQILGRATVALNGQVFNSKNGASLDVGGVTRETETTDRQSDYVESIRPAVVKCQIPLNRGVSVAALNDVTRATVQFIADTGQSYILTNAWRVSALEVTGGQSGGMDLEFHANSCVEVGV